ncbi:MAG: bis(5'-nucleosyl)-tetraphosphatase (symmetrical) YqeK, partial [Bacillota bacterium]
AGLVHDYGKGFHVDVLLKQAAKLGLTLDRITMAEPRLLHAPVGAALLPVDLQIVDAAVIKAVAYHTTGRRGASLLERIIYLADFIEPNRSYPGVEKLRPMARDNLEQALLAAVEQAIRSVLERGLLLHPRSIGFRNDLLAELRGIGG